MCCVNYGTDLARIISKAILDGTFRERFLADPLGTAQEFGLSEADRNQLAKYEPRKLRAMVEGPPSNS
ncbi:MAG TPA: Os1348 family NHLP clan protein [Nitrospirota bacterium]|nr:Os1348 family NHLP clan protein [Nitrospirota bacterium]